MQQYEDDPEDYEPYDEEEACEMKINEALRDIGKTTKRWMELNKNDQKLQQLNYLRSLIHAARNVILDIQVLNQTDDLP